MTNDELRESLTWVSDEIAALRQGSGLDFSEPIARLDQLAERYEAARAGQSQASVRRALWFGALVMAAAVVSVLWPALVPLESLRALLAASEMKGVLGKDVIDALPLGVSIVLGAVFVLYTLVVAYDEMKAGRLRAEIGAVAVQSVRLRGQWEPVLWSTLDQVSAAQAGVISSVLGVVYILRDAAAKATLDKPGSDPLEGVDRDLWSTSYREAMTRLLAVESFGSQIKAPEAERLRALRSRMEAIHDTLRQELSKLVLDLSNLHQNFLDSFSALSDSGRSGPVFELERVKLADDYRSAAQSVGPTREEWDNRLAVGWRAVSEAIDASMAQGVRSKTTKLLEDAIANVEARAGKFFAEEKKPILARNWLMLAAIAGFFAIACWFGGKQLFMPPAPSETSVPTAQNS